MGCFSYYSMGKLVVVHATMNSQVYCTILNNGMLPILWCFMGRTLVTGSDGSMSISSSAGLGFNPQRGREFSFENFQPQG